MEFKPDDHVVILPREDSRDGKFARLLWGYSKEQWVVEFIENIAGSMLGIINEDRMIHARDADNEAVFVILPKMGIYCKE